MNMAREASDITGLLYRKVSFSAGPVSTTVEQEIPVYRGDVDRARYEMDLLVAGNYVGSQKTIEEKVHTPWGAGEPTGVHYCEFRARKHLGKKLMWRCVGIPWSARKQASSVLYQAILREHPDFHIIHEAQMEAAQDWPFRSDRDITFPG